MERTPIDTKTTCPNCGGEAVETMSGDEYCVTIVRECLTCESTDTWSEDV